MKVSTTTTTIEPSSMSNRRQPTRQARTNPPRNAASATRPFGGRGSLLGQQDDRAAANASPGFFPAITHFTDSISALPKEMIRHYTMLKEVDAKICGPEDTLKQLVNAVLKAPVPPRKYPVSGRNSEHYPHTATRANTSAAGSVSGNAALGVPSHEETNSQHEAPTPLEMAEYSRRQMFHQLRMVMSEMLTTLDEKNHVMSTATDALNKQLKRCESSFPHINDEISEETRLGNPRHWAYLDKTAEKKGTTAGERTRRDAAAANNLAASAALTQEGELAALRSEARREAVAARKQRAQHVDSDFDDSRGAKKPPAQAKSRKVADINPISNGSGVGITNGQSASATNPPSKRRRVEKPVSAGIVSGMSMERSMSAAYGTIATAGRGGGVSPRETPAVETTKKRGRAGTVTNGTTRRRTGTNASAVNSPLIASSPVVGTFAAAIKGGNSPALGAMQRSQSTRGRQSSTQTSQEPSRSQNPSSSSTKHANGSGLSIPQLDGPSAPREPRTTKEAPAKPDSSIPTDPDPRTSSRSHDRPSLKREAASPPPPRSRAERPPSISTTTRTSGKASKTATPLSSSFPEPTRPRSGRNTEPTVKRSHKKGAGVLAQQQLRAAQQAAQEEELEGSAAEEGDEEHEGEPRYCYCNGVSYGEMVACDGAGCEIEWFHLECAGLVKSPKGKWFCDACKKKLKA